MPNVTSYSGSWLVWFAEREPVPGAASAAVRPPVPLRKVDPKYIAAAAAERVEGKVRLFGVIGKDGHVDGIALLRASGRPPGRAVRRKRCRNGNSSRPCATAVPVDVDAIFEIPFHLGPGPHQ